MKARVIALLSVLLIFFALVPAALAQTGGEESPVGTPETPVNGPALRLDTPVTVELSGTTPVNLSYKTAGSETVSISVRSLETEGVLDPTVNVLNGDGISIASNDDHSSSRTDLTPRNSLIERLALPEVGRYTVQVAGSDSSVTGSVEVLVSSDSGQTGNDTQAQTTKEDQGVNLSISDTVPPDSPYTTTFDARAGEVVTITVRATDNQLDPKVSLLDSSGAEVASNDDHDSIDSSLGPYDSQIPDFTIPKTDTYTVSISGFAGIGGTFDLTVQPGGGGDTVLNTDPTPPLAQSHRHRAAGYAGDSGHGQSQRYVYLQSYRSTPGTFTPSPCSPRPRISTRSVSIYLNNSYVIDNDDYGSSDPTLQSTDSRIYNWIFEESGQLRSRRARLSEQRRRFHDDDRPRGDRRADRHARSSRSSWERSQSGETYSYNFDAQEGDWVTITVRTLTTGFDPYVSLLERRWHGAAQQRR